MLLRVAKRYVSAEMRVEKFWDTEFGDRRSPGLDLAISVYRIDADVVVQCHTEHYAANDLSPRGRRDMDLDGLADSVVPRPIEDGHFSMRSSAHCEIRSDSERSVQELARRLFADLGDRSHEVSKTDMQTYVRRAIEAADEEWRAYMARPSVGADWRKLAGLA